MLIVVGWCFLVERRNCEFSSAMMSVIFVPTRSLPPCGFALTRPLPRRCLAICAAKRTSPNATPAFRPSIPSILKTLNAGNASVVQVTLFLFPPSPLCPAAHVHLCPSLILSSWFLHAVFSQVLESQSPFLKSSDWFALLEGLGKQNKWTITLEVSEVLES